MQLQSPTPQSHVPRRSVFVTVLSWAIIVLSALFLPISGISLLMILAGSYGTNTFDPVGFFIVIILPPAAFVAAIGMLRRRKWGWYGVIALLGFLVAINGWELLTARAGTTTYTSDSGVLTTVTTSGPGLDTLMILAIAIVLLLSLLRRSIRDEFGIAKASHVPATAGPAVGQDIESLPPSNPEKDWRVGHTGRDQMYYEERQGVTWVRINIDGEMLTGRAHHVIYFASPQQWQGYPEWARHRREEIIARLKSEFRPPDYEYQGDTVGPAVSSARVTAAAPPQRMQPLRRPRSTPKQQAALVTVIVLLLSISGGMGVLVATGLGSDSTYFPAKRSSQQRTVVRQDEPVTFWASIAIYSAIGLLTGGLALWCTREAWRQGR